MARIKTIRFWVHGLLAAVIGGATSAGAAWMGMAGAKSAGVDVPTLNFKALGIILLSSGVAAAFAYLKQSPLPPIDEADDIPIRYEPRDRTLRAVGHPSGPEAEPAAPPDPKL